MKILSLSLMMVLVQGGRICTNPKGNDGESYTEGCLKMTCKTGVWRSSLETSLCCYDRQPYLPNTTITATEDGCASAIMYCTQEDDLATAVLQVENTCGDHSTEEQVQELKHLLVTHMEQTDCDKDSPTTSSTTNLGTHGMEGLVISGGWGGEYSVEMFIPSIKHSCTLPSLPDERYGHTMSGLTICGGWDTSTTCLQLSSGVWSVSHTLQEERHVHSSWQSDQERVILMGGWYGEKGSTSSEVVGQGGVSFGMRYDTVAACAIPDGESVLLTGGVYTKQRVSRYDAAGYVSELPGLNIGRSHHACGAYLKQDGKKVFLVAGGRDDSDNTLSSTELMLEDSDVWSITSPLPRAVRGVMGVTLGNTLYMSGGLDENYKNRYEILAWSDERVGWEEVGKMKKGRTYHGITTINVDGVAAICG